VILSAATATNGLKTFTALIPATENFNAARVTHLRTTATVNVIPRYIAAKMTLGRQTKIAGAIAVENAAQVILSQTITSAHAILKRDVAV